MDARRNLLKSSGVLMALNDERLATFWAAQKGCVAVPPPKMCCSDRKGAEAKPLLRRSANRLLNAVKSETKRRATDGTACSGLLKFISNTELYIGTAPIISSIHVCRRIDIENFCTDKQRFANGIINHHSQL
ncbi:MAG: hypothetical protein Ta2B_16070 [Termitinemataceae bacterium]|nr:MAG: hypothetical protein Ta2B_16070 [Termitinemataceae bacterium]